MAPGEQSPGEESPGEVCAEGQGWLGLRAEAASLRHTDTHVGTHPRGQCPPTTGRDTGPSSDTVRASAQLPSNVSTPSSLLGSSVTLRLGVGLESAGPAAGLCVPGGRRTWGGGVRTLAGGEPGGPPCLPPRPPLPRWAVTAPRGSRPADQTPAKVPGTASVHACWEESPVC